MKYVPNDFLIIKFNKLDAFMFYINYAFLLM